MNYIKNNLIFLSLLLTTLIIFIVVLIFSFSYSSQSEQLLKKISQSQNSIDQSRNKILPFIGLDYELENARSDLEKLASIERDQNRLWNSILARENNIALNWEPEDTDEINEDLILQYTYLRKLCRDKNIILPGSPSSNTASPFPQNNLTNTTEFGFGFESYDGNWPNFQPEEAQKLGMQMAIIKQIVEYLSKSASNDHSLRLVRILRESVGTEDDSNIRDDKLIIDEFKHKLLKPQRIVESMCFEITFVGITSHARTFMNQLAPPYLLRDFAADRDTTNFSTTSYPVTPNLISPDPGLQENSELPIVKDVRSKYTFLIEYVTNLDRDHDKFFKSTMTQKSLDIEVMKDFLEKSGHSKMIEQLIMHYEMIKKGRDES